MIITAEIFKYQGPSKKKVVPKKRHNTTRILTGSWAKITTEDTRAQSIQARICKNLGSLGFRRQDTVLKKKYPCTKLQEVPIRLMRFSIGSLLSNLRVKKFSGKGCGQFLAAGPAYRKLLFAAQAEGVSDPGNMAQVYQVAVMYADKACWEFRLNI